MLSKQISMKPALTLLILTVAGLVGLVALSILDFRLPILDSRSPINKPAIPAAQIPLLVSRLPVSRPTIAEPDKTTQAKVQAAFSKLPLHFEPNQGQTDAEVKFVSRGRGYTLFLTSTEAVMVLRQPQTKQSALSHRLSGKARAIRQQARDEKGEEVDSERETQNSQLQTVLRMKLVGANPEAEVAGLEELPGKSHYFIGNDATKWRTNVPHYGKVKYEEVYPGIDLVFYGNQRQLEHDFVIAPGADPGAIDRKSTRLNSSH